MDEYNNLNEHIQSISKASARAQIQMNLNNNLLNGNIKCITYNCIDFDTNDFNKIQL